MLRHRSIVVAVSVVSSLLFLTLSAVAGPPPKDVTVINDPSVHVLSEPETPRQVEIVGPDPLPVEIVNGGGNGKIAVLWYSI